ncbi:MAG: HD domain-containing protein [Vicinamibacterales bacterium]
MARLPRIAEIDASSSGSGFFLCVRKERRTGRTGSAFLVLQLQDATGSIDAKVFQDVEQNDAEFDAGEFVAVQGRASVYNQRLELVIDRIRRVIPDDANRGFREEDCILCAPRPIDEMWAELESRLESVRQPQLRLLLTGIVRTHADKLRVWPAARQVHHAYRSGLLEHILKIMDVAVFLAGQYDASTDLVIAGALLHDIGKLQELQYDIATGYTVEGNLVGHISIGVGMLRDAVRELPDFPRDLAIHLEHLILSHHGSRELGSPVEPMTVEAFILAAADDFDAKMHQIRRHLATDTTDGPFTAYHRYLERVLYKQP